MLEVRNIAVYYGAAPALWDISLQVAPGELVCVVGPNGAGKTTLINAVAGLNRVRSGALFFDSRNITRLPSHRFCEVGIAVVPEGRRLFVQMSVLENLELGSFIPAARAHRKYSGAFAARVWRERRPVLRQQLLHAGSPYAGTGRANDAAQDALVVRGPCGRRAGLFR